MKHLTLKIRIAKTPSEVFAFVLDPRNTPLWLDFVVAEETNEWPPKLGTLYRNHNTRGATKEFVLTTFEPNRQFVMSEKNGQYHVRYTLTEVGKQETELEYVEWVDQGDIKDSFTIEILQKLKHVLESQP
jgi:hypothetical protein